MTNDEAIKLLSQIMDVLLASNSWLPSTKNPIKESFGMAINALTAQPEKMQLSEEDATYDCISRQAAIEAIKTWGLIDGLAEGQAIEILADEEKLPSAQPEIIHCQNCKHWREGDAYSYCQKLFNCGVLDVHDYMRAEDDFCSLAERRTDEADYRKE